ncbi:MAG TPA: VacB/RNase II family 3'-5' exoribonuclease [Bryobacteraceae bacterium]|nr:VacB/RNase II family 3'-5' exoribonuclease [Bryobacteraceae bacterium]
MEKRTGVVSDEDLLKHLSRAPHGRSSFKNVARELGAKGDDRHRLNEALERLTERGDLIELRGGQYVVARMSREYLLGRLQMHKDGYGFVIPDNRPDNMRGDLFIPPENTGRAMHGDRVIARVLRVEGDGKSDGTIVKILRRAHETVVGEFQMRKHGCYVKPHDDRIRQWIEIAQGMELPDTRSSVNRVGVEAAPIRSVEDLDGKIVNVEILEFGENGENSIGRVIEVLGSPDDFGIDVEIIIRKFHIPHQFPDDVLRQAEDFPKTIPAVEIGRRHDYRGFQVVTIDGETARDFDDAVWVDKLESGNYELHVHIADVGYYVRPGSPIDREALKRGTSVYFPDRAVPMLPMELSTELCSLKPQVDRLVLSAILEIDNKGDVVNQEFTKGVICSVERMTYTNVHLLLEGDKGVRERYAALIERFELMKELALKLNRKRTKRGSIDFDLPEPLIEFDTQGEMIGVVRSPRNIAHRIIEEFMLAANEAVASHLEQADVPSIYRIHEQPDPKRIMDFEEVAARFGYSLNAGPLPVKKFRSTDRRRDGRKVTKEIVLPDEKISIPSRAYQKLTAKLEGKPEERILTYLMLRSLKQARYKEENAGHYALAAESYTHFTSPIRRYPDLIVHRLLSEYMERRMTSLTEDQLRSIAEECSQTERRADEAERELVEWKKAKFMEQHVGGDFDALVISVTKYGLFVELDKFFVEGLVPIDTLPADRYIYHENTRKIVGDRSRREFSIGDRVRVVLDRVDAIERKLQFSLLDPTPARRRKRDRR